LVALEWDRDVKFITSKILSGSEYSPFYLAGKAYEEYKKARNSFANTLIELLQSAQLRSYADSVVP